MPLAGDLGRVGAALAALLALLLFASAACAADAPGPSASGSAGTAPVPVPDALQVSRAWARATTSDAMTAAVYLTLEDRAGSPRSLLSVSCPRCDHCELHHHLRDAQGVMHMLPLKAVTVPAHGTLVLEPGGIHVMLIGLTRGLSQGERITLVLHGEGGDVTCQVPVLGAAAMGPDP